MSTEKKIDNMIEQRLQKMDDDEILDLDNTSELPIEALAEIEKKEKVDEDAAKSAGKDTAKTADEDSARSSRKEVARAADENAKPREQKKSAAAADRENTPKNKTEEIASEYYADNISAAKKKAPKYRRKNPLIGVTIVLALTTLAAILLCFYVIYYFTNKSEETISEEVAVVSENNLTELVTYDQATVDELIASAREDASFQKETELKTYIRSVASTKNPNFAEMLRQLYTDDIVYIDGDGYHFIPINESLGLHNIKKDQLYLDEEGNYTYVEDGAITSKRVIDVSQHQGKIDWAQVAEAGIDYAIIRVGFRGYGSGALVEDEQFQNNINGAKEAGIKVGVYFFTQAVNAEEAIEEAQFVLEAIAPYKIDGPIAIDVEKPDDNSARGNSLSAIDRTGYVKLFCQAIEKEGYTPMIYGNTYSMFAMLDISQLTDYQKWYAFYNNYLYYPYEVKIWQYSASADIPGIGGNVDINIMFDEN